MTLTYVTGGIRSGKSEFAEQLAFSQAGRVLYVAFGVQTDQEMEKRIDIHKKRRPSDWDVLEEPNELTSVQTVYQDYDVILVDCISSWLANQCMWLTEQELKEDNKKTSLIEEVELWLKGIQENQQHVFVVSNEVGLGGVALSSLGRFFQDVLGKINQLLAAEADEAYAVFSGLPLRLK
ncbi:adenosylcobinamide kinase /adenosylcobinamide-phosphate guanylyltransferase [Neobacillus bataviensis]|uniref:Adenosylcobinamide kinase n=1 Tax=Neobacillus bataviensis TaxID=220685 RepID=A0A561DXH7_9BACI|nr:bifunctional adenosylcobinamide kinase/adenosylcobinamide-phosphate guanylyltransferase [Neobacillus bataviensis]TWE08063.1 adenosylcobinamide kinase /adenosylcobinamide-phosphate guanylyltransferase [Neobacillus bataviensis]